jgi:hypothetical protein
VEPQRSGLGLKLDSDFDLLRVDFGHLEQNNLQDAVLVMTLKDSMSLETSNASSARIATCFPLGMNIVSFHALVSTRKHLKS